MQRIILASGSPRRRELLQRLGFFLTVQPSEADEHALPEEDALHLAPRLARAKGEWVAAKYLTSPEAIILAADTIVAYRGKLLGKPASEEEAFQTLKLLSGNSHSVVSGVYVKGPKFEGAIAVETHVTFRLLSDREIRWYVSTGEPMDKAGAYAIQGIAGAFVTAIQGSHSNVIGLPMAETLELLAKSGASMPWDFDDHRLQPHSKKATPIQ